MTIRSEILGELDEGGDSFVMGAPHMLHLFDVPTKMESIAHLEELGRQYRRWLQGQPKRPDGASADEEKFNFVKGESSDAESEDRDVGVEAGSEDGDEDGNQTWQEGESAADASRSEDGGPPPSTDRCDMPVRGCTLSCFSPRSHGRRFVGSRVLQARFDPDFPDLDPSMYDGFPVTDDGEFISDNQLAARPYPVGESFRPFFHPPHVAHFETPPKCAKHHLLVSRFLTLPRNAPNNTLSFHAFPLPLCMRGRSSYRSVRLR